MTNPKEMKDRLYKGLDILISAVANSEKLILGDLNTRVAKDHVHDLSFFLLPIRNRTSWIYLRSKHWHLIDYVITKRRDKRDVKVTEARCGVDGWADHRLIMSKDKIQILPKGRPQGKKLDVQRVNCLQTQAGRSGG